MSMTPVKLAVGPGQWLQGEGVMPVISHSSRSVSKRTSSAPWVCMPAPL
jgi:hypothetical protein